MIEEEGGCSYHYKWNETLARWELFVVVCQDGFEPDWVKIAGVPIADGQKAPNIIRLTTPKQPVTPGLSVTVTESMGLGDNQFEVVYGLTKVPNALDNGTIRDSERWKPLRGLPTKLRTGDQDLASDLDTFDYNFNLPDNAVVRGIKVDVQRQTESLSDTVAADSGQLFLRRWWDATPRVDVFVLLSSSAEPVATSAHVTSFTDYPNSHLDTLGQWWNAASNADGSIILVMSNQEAGTGAGLDKGISRSTDNGLTFTHIGLPSATIPKTYGWDHAMGFGDGKFMAFEVVTQNATATCWTSTDGLTWTEKSGNIILSGGTINDVHYWPLADRWYLTCISVTGSRYGLRTSTGTSGGATWTNCTGTDTTGDWDGGLEALDLHLGPKFCSDGTAMLIIAKDTVLYRTTDTDANPTLNTVTTTGWGEIYTVHEGGGTMIAATANGIRRSTDSGATFGSNVDVTGGETDKTVRALAYNSLFQIWYAAAGTTKTLFWSDDAGVTWNKGTGTYTNVGDPIHMFAPAQ
jgi:hypothetical protein